MRKKLIDSKCFHVELENKATSLLSDIYLSEPTDLYNDNGIVATGVWDTGAEGCLISKKLAETLGLVLVSMKYVIGVNSNKLSPEYLVNLFLPNNINFEMVSVLEGENLADDEFIIGMNIINQGDFAITNVNSKTTFSFRVPSLFRINFETDKEKAIEEESSFTHKRQKSTWGTKRNRKRKIPKKRK